MRRNRQLTTHLPPAGLWDAHGGIDASRVRALGANEIVKLLERGPVQFVIADAGLTLEWVPSERCVDFWEAEVRGRLVAPSASARHREPMPDGYGYAAAEWATTAGAVVVLLEKRR